MEKKRRRLRKNYFLVNFIIVLLLIGGLIYLAGTDKYTVKTIVSKGNSHYSLGEIVELADIESDLNIFKFPVKQVKEELLKDPYIKAVAVSRKLPNKILITVEERSEEAGVVFGDKFVVIDYEGIILNIAETKPDVTIIKGITLTNIKTGTKIDAEEETLFMGALELLSVMENHDLFFREIKIVDSGIRAYVYDELYCEGRPENILKSIDDLKDVLYDLYVNSIERGIVKVGGGGYISYSAVIE